MSDWDVEAGRAPSAGGRLEMERVAAKACSEAGSLGSLMSLASLSFGEGGARDAGAPDGPPPATHVGLTRTSAVLGRCWRRLSRTVSAPYV